MQHKYAVDAKAHAFGTGESLVLSNPVTIYELSNQERYTMLST